MFKIFLEFLHPRNIDRLSSVRYIFLAGEALSAAVINQFRCLESRVVLENIYGPTEATIYASKFSLSGWDGKDTIPIGKPLQNVKLYILNRYNLLQPIGVTGELCIGGVGIARGYLNNPELTSEKFILPQTYLSRQAAIKNNSHRLSQTKTGIKTHTFFNQKFLEVQKPFFKKVSGRRRQKLMVE